MPGPYTESFLDLIPPTGNPYLLSVALYMRTSDLSWLSPGDRETLRGMYLQAADQISACHEIAVSLCAIIGNAGPCATGQAGLELMGTVLDAQPGALRIKYRDHSITLIVQNGLVESIEGWAGQGANALPFHYCLTHRADEKRPTVDEARKAFANLLHVDFATRSDAWDTISRAGLDGFESGAGLSPDRLEVQKYQLKALTDAVDGLDGLIDESISWASPIWFSKHKKRLCAKCRKFAEPAQVQRTWHQCTGCKRLYCPDCVDSLLPHGGGGRKRKTLSGDAPKACSVLACGKSTRPIPGPKEAEVKRSKDN